MDRRTLLLLSKLYNKKILFAVLSLYKYVISHKLISKENVRASLSQNIKILSGQAFQVNVNLF